MNAVRPGRGVAIGGARIWVDDDQPTFWDRVERGAWEPGTLAALAPRLGPGTVFLDLGAWVGPLSLFAASRGARVVAVEADPAALDQLRRNLSANPDLADAVTVIPRAVSADGLSVTFGARRKPGDSMSSRFLAGASSATWQVDGITPSQLSVVAGPGRLLVKLDIEGGEYDLLPAFGPLLDRDGAGLLASFHPAILREAGVSDAERLTRDALAIVEGWTSYAVEAGGPVERKPDPIALAAADRPDYPDTWLFLHP